MTKKTIGIIVILGVAAVLMLMAFIQGYNPHRDDHYVSEKVIKEPTCTTEGILKETCWCGYTAEKPIAATHVKKNEKERIKPSTCTDDGVLTKYCTECDFIQEEVIPKGHKYILKELIDKESCTDDGSGYFTCSGCGNEIIKIIEATGHKFISNECTNCGAKKSNISPDTWYVLRSNNVVMAQNAEVSGATPQHRGSAYFIVYNPVCSDCHVAGITKSDAVEPGNPITRTYWCNDCRTPTYVKFKLEY